MKSISKSKNINHSSRIIGALFVLMSSHSSAGTMGPILNTVPETVYAAVFGGVNGANKILVGQYANSFYTEANGGPLAVNAFGHVRSSTTGLIGGQIGYHWSELALQNLSLSSWTLGPAIELEGYYLGKHTFTGYHVNNETPRLLKHFFEVKYPTYTGVFLTNAVLDFKQNQHRIHPYIGAGIGVAAISITNASFLQLIPLEPNINHYNSHPYGSHATFAAQGKVGLNFQLKQNVDFFIEYRRLYLAHSNFTFGSTNYPTHNVTTAWQVEMNHQSYNIGDVGLRVNI